MTTDLHGFRVAIIRFSDDNGSVGNAGFKMSAAAAATPRVFVFPVKMSAAHSERSHRASANGTISNGDELPAQESGS